MNAASQISAVPGTLAPGAGVSPVTSASEPAGVRDGSPKAKQAYETARGFEEVLMQQLSQQLVKSSGLEGEAGGSAGGEEEGADAGIALGRRRRHAELVPAAGPQRSAHAWRNAGYRKSADGRARPLGGNPKSASGASSPVSPSGGVEA